MKTTTKFISVVLSLFSVFNISGYAQENLEVLSGETDQLFHSYLMEVVDSLSASRKNQVEQALNSVEALEARQEQLRSDYRMLIGNLPDKTPLNAQVVNTIEEEGYSIDMVHYQSRPNHHVTANFYYPTTGSGPYPAVIITVGHYPIAKSQDLLQKLSILFAKNGIAALIVDPICQAERNQIINPRNGELMYASSSGLSKESGTKAHTRLDVGSMLVGTSAMAYELWDNYRSIDYLLTRPEVDAEKIGCTGSSGGGAQATYLVAFDDRIKVAAVNSFIMNEPTLFKTIGPQTGSQNLSYEGEYGIDHPDYITMFAPKPFMILADSSDFFAIEGTDETHEEVKKVYEKLGVPEKIGYATFNTGHGYGDPEKRETAVQWFRKWLYNDPAEITEGDLAIHDEDTLWVTETGQVYREFADEKVVADFNVEYAESYSADRSAFWSTQTNDSCLNMVRKLIKLDDNDAQFNAEITETIDRGHYTIEKIKLTSGNRVPVAGLMFIPENVDEKMPGVLYIDGLGKDTDAEPDGLIEQLYMDSSQVVFAIDVRGFGETKDSSSDNESKHGNKEHRNAVISGYVGKTLIGQRVWDINKAMNYFMSRDEIDTEDVSIVGIDRAGTSVLHAAALDNRYNEVVIRKYTDTTWVSIVEKPTVLHNLTHVVPSALKFYDLPDLVNAIAPRPVTYMAEEPELEVGIAKVASENIGSLEQNYPNPCKNATSISYSLSSPGYVNINIYTNSGKNIMPLTKGWQTVGNHETTINTSSLPSGIYHYQLLVNGSSVNSRKMVVKK